MTPHLPLITSVSWILPVSYLFYKNNRELEPTTSFLLFIMIIMTVFSCMFWMDPISHKNTLVHTLDAGCARFTIFVFVAYNIVFQPENVAFFVSVVIMSAFFYSSDCCSKEEWCGDYHIYNHLGAHFFALLGIYFTLNYETIQ
jgi:hypothetical protein